MNLNQSILKHVATYSFASVASKIIGFIMLPFYAHILRGFGYGVLGMVDASMSLLASLFYYGTTASIIRFYHEEQGEKKKKVISTAVILTWGVGAFMLLLFGIPSPQLSNVLFGDSSHYTLLCLALISFAFDLAAEAAGCVLIIEQRSILFSALNLLRLIVGLSLNIVLLVVLKMGLLGYFLSSAIAACVSALIFNGIAVAKCGISLDRGIAHKLIAFSLPLIPGNLISYVSRQTERILTRFMIGLESVGILEMGYKFPPLLGLMVAEPFFRAWHTKRTEIAEKKGAPQYFGKVFTYFLFLLTFFGLFLAVGMKDVIEMLTPPEFWPAQRIARVEIVTVFFMACYNYLLFGLYYEKKTKLISLILCTASLIKILFSIVFIKKWGINGAAYSACLATAIQLVWTTYKSQAVYPILIEYKKIGIIIALALLLDAYLAHADLSETTLGDYMESYILYGFHYFFDPTGRWQWSGVLSIMMSKSQHIVSLTLKTMITCSYLLIFPLIYEPSAKRLSQWLRFRHA